MENTKAQAAWFIFGRVIWPTFDTYCDISISVYCILEADAWAWGLVMMVPLLYHIASAISSYVRMRKENMLEKNDLTWIAIPFFIWPQLQAGKIGKAMWDEAEDWKRRKDQQERYESRGESSIEGITQSLIVSFIVVQKYVEKNEEYGYQLHQDVDGRDSFGIPVLTFMIISALGSLLSGIVGTYQILRKWPLRMELGTGVGNKILLATIIIFGMISRFGAFSIVFIFSTDLEPVGLADKFKALVLLGVVFVGFQFTLCMIPLQGLGPARFWNLFLSYPHIHIIPLITPFTFGLVCDKDCRCHCCSCCGCSKPRLALSRSLTLANHVLTLLLMIPPVAFFGWLESWDTIAVQLCIVVLGLCAVPILLFQPGRIIKLGILDPDNIGGHLISNVKDGGRTFRLATAKLVQKSTAEEPVQG